MARKRRSGGRRKSAKKAITARQKSARRKNIAVARSARKKGGAAAGFGKKSKKDFRNTALDMLSGASMIGVKSMNKGQKAAYKALYKTRGKVIRKLRKQGRYNPKKASSKIRNII
jgi:hypothetical protein